MDREKIKACIVSFSRDSSALVNLQRIITVCANPPIILSGVFKAASDETEIQETIKAIDRVKPRLVFIVLSSDQLEEAEFIVKLLQEEGFQPYLLAFLEDPNSAIMIDLMKMGFADVISPPFTPEHVVPRVWRNLKS